MTSTKKIILLTTLLLVGVSSVVGIGALISTSQSPSENTTHAHIRAYSVPLESTTDVQQIVDHAQSAEFVLLGESSHGTQEYYAMRSEISKQLIAEHGFKAILVEADWPYMLQTNQHVLFDTEENALQALQKNTRWPEWMWANPEFLELIEWIHQYNMQRQFSQRVAVYGMDVQNQELAEKVAERILHEFPSKENETYHQQLKEKAHLAHELSTQYMEAMQRNVPSWNIRVRGMKQLVEKAVEIHDGPVIIWAHNTHIGDARATDMVQQGSFNIGQLLRQKYGNQNVYSLGFGTYTGSVSAGLRWGQPKQILNIPPAPAGSLEHLLNLVEIPLFFLDLTNENVAEHFATVIPHRAKGVVYNPNQETMNYVPTVLPKRYDGFVFFSHTTYLQSLDR